MMSEKQIQELPESSSDFWDGEVTREKPKPISICKTHSRRNAINHIGYKDNQDGTASCKYCPFGVMLGANYRVVNERLVSVRKVD
jgi:hypothetical protein